MNLQRGALQKQNMLKFTHKESFVKRVCLSTGMILYLLSVGVVLLSAWSADYSNLLKTTTKENGLFETISVILLLAISTIGILWSWKNRLHVNKIYILGVTLFSLVAFLAAMEEISWGQHYFGFESSEYFKAHNHQKETNLHNLMPAEIFSSIIYTSVYAFYVFIPLFVRLIALKSTAFGTIIKYLPSLHVSLLILFGCSLQAYFYDDFGAWFDTATLIGGILFLGTTITILKLWDMKNALHFGVITLATLFFMSSYEVFSFYNMQYEIREMFVVFGTLCYFHSLLQKLAPQT